MLFLRDRLRASSPLSVLDAEGGLCGIDLLSLRARRRASSPSSALDAEGGFCGTDLILLRARRRASSPSSAFAAESGLVCIDLLFLRARRRASPPGRREHLSRYRLALSGSTTVIFALVGAGRGGRLWLYQFAPSAGSTVKIFALVDAAGSFDFGRRVLLQGLGDRRLSGVEGG